jgi:hypothetical protein
MKTIIIKRLRRLIIGILLTFNITVLGLDFLLWQLDPLGTKAMVYNWVELSHHALLHPTGFMYPQGTIDLGAYSVTTIADGKRLVPDSSNGACVIAFIGDSVTWGQGVNDDETFVNRLASHFPNVTIWNTGRNRYSISNVAASIDHYQANGYIWTLISNDTEPFAIPETYTRYPSALELYLTTFVSEYRYAQRLNTLVWGDDLPLVVQIVTRPDTLVFGFENDPLAIEAESWGVTLIPYPEQVVSVADKHPNAVGHEQIADSLLPFVTPFISRICHA